MTGYVEVGLSRVETDQTFTDPFFHTTGLSRPRPACVRSRTTSTSRRASAGNPFTRTGQARYVGSSRTSARATDIESDTFRFLAGLTYTFGKWDLDSAVGYSKNEIDQTQPHLAVGRGRRLRRAPTPQPPIPMSTTSTYNLDDWTRTATRSATRSA